MKTQKFKEYLSEQSIITEATTNESTLMESVLATLYNRKRESKKSFYSTILDDSDISAWLKVAQISTWKGTPISSYLKRGVPKSEADAKIVKDALWNLKTLISKSIKSSGRANQAGTSRPSVSGFWADVTGKAKDTSKSDIMIGKNGVSVKNMKAQLMTSMKDETKATALSAFDNSNLDKKVQADVLEKIDSLLESVRTAGKATKETTERLGLKIPPNAPDQERAFLNTANTRLMDNKGMKDGFTDVEQKLNNETKILLDNSVATGKEVLASFNSAFKDATFKSAFAYEAMTGYEKFLGGVSGSSAGGKDGYANSMLIFAPDFNSIRWEPVKNKNSSYVKHVASQMSVQVSAKSSHYKKQAQKYGYSFYQSLRLGIDTLRSEFSTMTKANEAEIEKYQNMLNEGYMNEGQMFDKLKALAKGMVAKVKGMWNRLVERLKKLKDQITVLWNEGVYEVMKFFNIDIIVKVNTIVNLM